jgi:hypothetical protein
MNNGSRADFLPLSKAAAESELNDWHRVYHGLSEAEVFEVEQIALDRSHFSRVLNAPPPLANRLKRSIP